ncbi:MAG: threonylcarbamoyl-AMP synthase [Magnetococcales bacterium]|nr:threonylcarbamoyl-AMP synthase [Magnetococcales bacterium]MBF0261769.1 threonylcarbamoyl-AMP synthase [Magnetococcales bacterium]
MAQFINIHPKNPQPRLIAQAVEILREGGVIVYPTDTTYGLGCGISSRKGVERIMRIKQLANSHQLSILVSDLSDIAHYARVDNATYRLLKRFLPGPYTFILDATREVPKSILPRRKTIGLRIPDHPICLELLKSLGEPLLSTSMRFANETEILSDPYIIHERTDHLVDLVIDAGLLPASPSTVVDLTGSAPEVLRAGAGDPTVFSS